MITETTYMCEVCKIKYGTSEQAIRCESRGIPDINIFPVGLIWIDIRKVGHGDAAPGTIPVFVFAIKNIYWETNSHSLNMSAWACRNNVHGDNLGTEGVGFSYIDKTLFNGKSEIDNWDRPEVKRMISYLLSEGITPTYFKNGILQTYNNPQL